jgi:hypothetical protein
MRQSLCELNDRNLPIVPHDAVETVDGAQESVASEGSVGTTASDVAAVSERSNALQEGEDVDGGMARRNGQAQEWGRSVAGSTRGLLEVPAPAEGDHAGPMPCLAKCGGEIGESQALVTVGEGGNQHDVHGSWSHKEAVSETTAPIKKSRNRFARCPKEERDTSNN